MRFVFKARDQHGKIQGGIVEAINTDLAAHILQKNNLTPISLEREGDGKGIFGEFKRQWQKAWEGVPAKDQVGFFRQLATLIEAHVPMVSALTAIGEQMENRFFQSIIREMVADVEDGMPFSESLAKHPDVFSPLAVHIIHAGEVSGNLQKSISFVADNIEKNYQLTSRIKGALIYPAFVISVAGIVGFLIISFILPKLTLLIRDLDVEIPWYTQTVITVGDFMGAYWWAVALVILSGLVGLVYYVRSKSGREEWEELALKLPLFGRLLRYVYLARFSENLGSLLGSGIPVVRSLNIVGDVVGNKVYQRVIMKAAEEVRVGGNMSTAFAKYPDDIPSTVTQMIRVGEESGKMNVALTSTARFYASELDTMTRNIVTLIEPILIVLLGLGVAVLVFAVIVPIYNIVGQL